MVTAHTGIVQSVAGLQSIYNTVLYRSRKLIASEKTPKCSLISDLFSESAATAFTSFGYTLLFGNKYRKLYSDDDLLCANFINNNNSHIPIIYFLFTSLVFYRLYLWHTPFLRFQIKTNRKNNAFTVQ